MAITLTQINTSSDTFQTWIDKTNTLISVASANAVTTAQTPTGASTTGNAAIVGIFNANTIAVGTALRGGTVNVAANLTISSNTTFSSNVAINSSSFVANVGGGTMSVYAQLSEFYSNSFVATGNVNLHSNTLTITTGGRVGINTASATAALDVVGSANFSGGNVTISGATSLSGPTNLLANVVLSGTTTTVTGAFTANGTTTFANTTTTNATVGTLNVTTGASFSGTTNTNNLYVAGTLNLAAALPVSKGGTGATDAATARTNLGLGGLASVSTVASNNFANVVSLTIRNSAGATLLTLYSPGV